MEQFVKYLIKIRKYSNYPVKFINITGKISNKQGHSCCQIKQFIMSIKEVIFIW